MDFREASELATQLQNTFSGTEIVIRFPPDAGGCAVEMRVGGFDAKRLQELAGLLVRSPEWAEKGIDAEAWLSHLEARAPITPEADPAVWFVVT